MDDAAEFESWRTQLGEILHKHGGVLRDVDRATIVGVGLLLARHRGDRAGCAARLGLQSKQAGYLWGQYQETRRPQPLVRFKAVALVTTRPTPGLADRFRVRMCGGVDLEFETVETAARLIRRMAVP